METTNGTLHLFPSTETDVSDYQEFEYHNIPSGIDEDNYDPAVELFDLADELSDTVVHGTDNPEFLKAEIMHMDVGEVLVIRRTK